MFYRLLIGVFVFCFAETVFAGTFAVTNQAEADYGKVVHSFFAKDYKAALTFFDRVEKADSSDPRPYYYAGLIYKRLKQTETGDKYYKKAAGLEFGDGVRREYDVAAALERVQGRERLTIEKFREEARTKWQAEERRRNEIKYNEQKAKDAQTVESFVQPNPVQDEKIVQALTKPGDFGAKAVEPTNPSMISKVLPRTEPKQEEAVEIPEASDSEAAKTAENAETAEDSGEDADEDKDENPFAGKDKAKSGKAKAAVDDSEDGDDENPFAEALKRNKEAKAAAKKKKTADDEDESEEEADAEDKETVESKKQAADDVEESEEEADAEDEVDSSDEKSDADVEDDSSAEKEEK